MSRALAAVCTAFFVISSLVNMASAATYSDTTISLTSSNKATPSRTADNPIKLADGGFGAGLAVGIIGTLVVKKLEKHDRHYRYHSYPRHRSCRYWHRRCADNWGYRNKNYYGCLRYHDC